MASYGQGELTSSKQEKNGTAHESTVVQLQVVPSSKGIIKMSKCNFLQI